MAKPSKKIILRPRGTQDIFFPRSAVMNSIFEKVNSFMEKNNYRLLIFPVFESEELFVLLGEETDVRREMYHFLDKKGRRLVLRPEGTLSTVRAVLQNKLLSYTLYTPLKLYYWANMFRYERPQKNRYREFWQLGVELIGASGIWMDFEVIRLAAELLMTLGIANFKFSLNYLGDLELQKEYVLQLKKYINEKNIFNQLCHFCQKRFFSNSLRILDCKSCFSTFNLPLYNIVWRKEEYEYTDSLARLLNIFKIDFFFDYSLVRGLDYYNGLVFEVFVNDEQTALLGGGRYDGLYERLQAASSVPAIGFSLGIERLLFFLESSTFFLPKTLDVFFFLVAPIKEDLFIKLQCWINDLREFYLTVDYFCCTSLKNKNKKENLPFLIDSKLLIILKKEFVLLKIKKKEKVWETIKIREEDILVEVKKFFSLDKKNKTI